MNPIKVAIEEQDKEFENNFKCIQSSCDSNGSIANQISEDEWEQQQCQFCHVFFLPLKAHLHSRDRAIIEAVIDEVKFLRMGDNSLYFKDAMDKVITRLKKYEV